MDYEKKYKEALEIARQIHNGNPSSGTAIVVCEQIFPELRESEDEKTRTLLVALVQWAKTFSQSGLLPNVANKMLSYLEKQKDAFENGRQLGIMQEQARQELEGTDEKQKEQKPVEEIKDQRQIYFMIEDGRRCGMIEGRKQVIDNPEKYGLQKPAEWSEEDENIRKQLISICDEWLSGGYNARPCLNDVRWLKNLLETQKELTLAEWSKEDKDILNCCISSIEEAKENRYAYKETDGDTSYDREIDWLKSLRPQSHWKPSEEQMDCLCAAVDAAIRKHNESVSGYKPARVLKSLYEQLQKLM